MFSVLEKINVINVVLIGWLELVFILILSILLLKILVNWLSMVVILIFFVGVVVMVFWGVVDFFDMVINFDFGLGESFVAIVVFILVIIIILSK